MNRYEYLSSVCVPFCTSWDHSLPIPNCLWMAKELIKKSGLVVVVVVVSMENRVSDMRD